jgi:hypothetical protein
MVPKRPDVGESGQALVETALTMPITLFLVLGILQLFLIFQGRVMAQYAAARSTRAGSLKSGECKAMVHSAVAALLPTFTPTRTPQELAKAFDSHKDGKYVSTENAGHDETIVWVIRVTPDNVVANDEEEFDLGSANPRTLLVKLVFWYPMRIPFANWVISAIVRAQYGLGNLTGANPLMPTQSKPDWSGNKTLDPQIANEFVKRVDANHYVMPIQVTYSMRMMTPARVNNFGAPPCQPFP